MKKKIVSETISYLITGIMILGFFAYRAKVKAHIAALSEINADALALQESLSVESKFENYQFPDSPLLSKNGEPKSVHSLLKSDKINIFVVTTLDGCNECRDLELQRWGLFAQEFMNVNGCILVIDSNLSQEKRTLELEAIGKGLSGLPVYFDAEENILEAMALTPSETPLIFFLSQKGETIFCYKGDYRIQKRSQNFLNIMRQVGMARETN